MSATKENAAPKKQRGMYKTNLKKGVLLKMQIKLGFGKRITAFVLALCCVFSMFPSALAAEDTDATENKAYRYIWLISQPGFSVRIENPSSGNTGVYFKNMTTKEDGGERDVWLKTKLYPDPTDGELYYVLIRYSQQQGLIRHTTAKTYQRQTTQTRLTL